VEYVKAAGLAVLIDHVEVPPDVDVQGPLAPP
jgi:hypothetical protein